MIKLLIYVSVLFLAACCEQQGPPEQSVLKDTNNLVHYTDDSLSKGSRKSLFLQHFANVLRLRPLFETKDSLDVRIWLWRSSGSYVIDLTANGTECTFDILQFKGVKIDSVQFMHGRRRWKTKLSGMKAENFLRMFNKIQKQDTATARELYRKGTLTMMTYIQFEIARPDQYEYREFLDPSYFRLVNSSSRDVNAFLILLNKELRVEAYNSDSTLVLLPESFN